MILHHREKPEALLVIADLPQYMFTHMANLGFGQVDQAAFGVRGKVQFGVFDCDEGISFG